MRQCAALWFSKDTGAAGRHYAVNPAGRKSLGALQVFMAEYSIIGRKINNTFEDLHRDGTVRAATESAYFTPRFVYKKNVFLTECLALFFFDRSNFEHFLNCHIVL